MKIKFKHQQYQQDAVNAVVRCFEGQPRIDGQSYRIDPGRRTTELELNADGFSNAEIRLTDKQLLENIRKVQREQNLPVSKDLKKFKELDNKGKLKSAPTTYKKQSLQATGIHLDIEMETGTGKTYCYIKTIYELNQKYGWSKFIIMVPSIAIRQGVYKSLQITAEHFHEAYSKKIRFFIYDSDRLHEIESFSSDGGINVMIINSQAFNAKGKARRRIRCELDQFQSRSPIKVIAANRPILILDEPQRLQGDATIGSLPEFNPLMILRYSATHKIQHNKIHQLDAIDAYNQKLVKKIAVRGIQATETGGEDGYLYLERIDVSPNRPPVAIIEFQQKLKSGVIKKTSRKCVTGDNFYALSNEMEQYKDRFVITDINANENAVQLMNGEVLSVGNAVGNISEDDIRRIQIRETIRAHMEKERALFDKGVKVLSLFFIDRVANYRDYKQDDERGKYARFFEEEYEKIRDSFLSELPLESKEYRKYLTQVDASEVHNGYFARDKDNRMKDPTSGNNQTSREEQNDTYNLIMKDKERLLSFDEPTRFIFSHSALSEGWDNPNIFTLCMLKQAGSDIRRRQEVGRGLRIAVNQDGERMDDPATIHDINVLTVVANESYQDFVKGLQKEILETLSGRPRKATIEYFQSMTIQVGETEDEREQVSKQMATEIQHYLIRNDYIDTTLQITDTYHDDRAENTLAELPKSLEEHREEIIKLIDSVFSDAQLPQIENAHRRVTNRRNQNYLSDEFKALWERLNQKVIYRVDFDSEELINDCIRELNTNTSFTVTPIQYRVVSGTQREEISTESLEQSGSFEAEASGEITQRDLQTDGLKSQTNYDLIGALAKATDLTRRTIGAILTGVEPEVFDKYPDNPEQFISKAARLINEKKATTIVKQITYDKLSGRHDGDVIFPLQTTLSSLSNAVEAPQKHVYDYVETDSNSERAFVNDLKDSAEITVFSKLPRGFKIPTPVGNYNPDWAIAFDKNHVTRVFFVAETKGSLSSLDLRGAEHNKIECARKFFERLNEEMIEDGVEYDVVTNFDELMARVGVR